MQLLTPTPSSPLPIVSLSYSKSTYSLPPHPPLVHSQMYSILVYANSVSLWSPLLLAVSQVLTQTNATLQASSLKNTNLQEPRQRDVQSHSVNQLQVYWSINL